MTHADPGSSDCLIGLMAGTSLDGVDAALVQWDERGKPVLIAAANAPYPEIVRRTIRATGPETPLHAVTQLDGQLGDSFAEAARAVMDKAGVTREAVRAIASHGQTVWHSPDRPYPASVQLGDPNRIAEQCGVDVVADFRRRDLAAGGQGAPLAPLFHRALFDTGERRAVLNLGGIANATLMGGNTDPTGFDTGPANTLLDAWYRRHRGGDFDPNGSWAATGQVDAQLLADLLDDAFFQKPPPRSTGPEHFNLEWLDAALHKHHGAPDNVQATLAELTARSAAQAMTWQLPDLERVILCGGGAHNGELVRRLKRNLPGTPIEDSSVHGIHPDWVEAVGFAWLGRETLAGRPGNAEAVTGARHRVVLGGVYRGR